MGLQNCYQRSGKAHVVLPSTIAAGGNFSLAGWQYGCVIK